MSNVRTLIQEVYFDICDAINEGDLYDYEIQGFDEFATVLDFLKEQKAKLEQIEKLLPTNEGEE